MWPRTIAARAAVVTLPVGVLRIGGDETAVAFSPGLPPRKREALRALEMGAVVKVGLWFENAFWERFTAGAIATRRSFADPGRFAAFWTQCRCAASWSWPGPAARRRSRCRARRGTDGGRAVDASGRCSASRRRRARILASFTHDWNADPFARGAYSYVATGGGDARAGLAAPIDGTLFFAGEATSTDGGGGTVNGALETGERAADEVLHG